MKNPPSFQFYPEAFLADLNVRAMTDKEVGRYIKLLCHCWVEDGLPTKGSRVVDLYLKNSPAILKCFYEKDGKYRQKRLDEEREKQRRWREKCSLGGQKSRKNKGNNKGSVSKGEVRGNTLPSSLYSLPSTLSSKEKDTLDSEFKQFWEAYPIQEGEVAARKAFEKLRETVPLKEIVAGFDGYMNYLKHERIKNKFERRAKNPATFLTGENWREFMGFKYSPPL